MATRQMAIGAALAMLLWTTAVARGGALSAPPGAVPMAALPGIDTARLLEQIKVIASDRFEGRLPGTRGEELTVTYLADEFRKLGLAPGNTDGTYFQAVPLVGITPKAEGDFRISAGAKAMSLAWRDDYVGWTSRVVDRTQIEGRELVFVGYGVEAPEFAWDDYKGADLAGKVMVVLVGDPPVPDPASPGQLDPEAFGGRAMTYYGRWTYKFEIGARKKAAGVIIVHETGPAGYAWGVVQGFGDERFNLRSPDRNMGRVAFEGWITRDRAAQLFALAGQDFDALKKSAATRGFTPVPLGATATVALRNTLRSVDSRNVIAKLEGADPALRDQYVVYSAHWDHFGVGVPVNGDAIYNGAEDNASGTAALLELARAFKALPAPPKRSILFLSVTGEEQGLVGSQHYAEHPVYPLEKTLANLNVDVPNLHGRTKDLAVVGLGASDLDDYARDAAAEQGRTLGPDPEPEKGGYYRSDHFNFAKQGVPAFYPKSGTDFVGRPPGYAQQIREDYLANRYHKPQDEVLPTWDLAGCAEDLKLLLAVGYRVAQAEKWPEWKPGNEFRATREARLKAAGGR